MRNSIPAGASAAALVLFAAAAPAQVPNDECTGAIPIVDGLNGPFSTVNATTSPEVWPCGNGVFDIWFTYTASCTGPITFDTCSAGTTFDTQIEVFDGSCTALNSLVCNDDSCGQQSRATVLAARGVRYYLRVGGYNGSSGGSSGLFDLNVACTTLLPNDNCPGALPVVDGVNGPYTTTGATDSPPPWPCEPTAGSDIWFFYVATCTGPVTFDTISANTTFDTVIEVFDGTCASLNSLDCNDDICSGLGGQSQAIIQATRGTTYLVRVGGWAQRQGSFDLNVHCLATPLNDECAGAVPVLPGVNGPFTTNQASGPNPNSPFSCSDGRRDLWFTWTATCASTVTVDTCSVATDFDTVLEAFQGSCANLSWIDCNDDSCGPTTKQSMIAFPTSPGTTYYFRVGGWRGCVGTFELTIALAGSGSFSSLPTGCGANTLSASGSPNIGGRASYAMGGVVGSPFIWLGIIPLSAPLCPPAACSLGTSFDVSLSGAVLSGPIPCDGSMIGAVFYVQGADLGAPGGCSAGLPAPLPLTVTDTIVTTIG